MKTRYLAKVTIAWTMLALVSCNNYLDLEPTNSVSDNLIWTSKANAQLVVNNMYEDVAYLGNYSPGCRGLISRPCGIQPAMDCRDQG